MVRFTQSSFSELRIFDMASSYVIGFLPLSALLLRFIFEYAVWEVYSSRTAPPFRPQHVRLTMQYLRAERLYQALIRRDEFTGWVKLKKVEPQVTISVAQLYHVWLIPAFFLNFPKEVLRFFFPLSISAEHLHWASYFDLLGSTWNLNTIKGLSRRWDASGRELEIRTKRSGCCGSAGKDWPW